MIAALIVAGCGRGTEQAASSPPSGSAPLASARLRASSPPVGTDLTAAAQLVRLYYERIGAHDYAGAWRLWSDDGAASKKSEPAFARGFADTITTRVTVSGPGKAEGAAGSIFATIPVRVDALLASGAEQHFTGSYVLRRVDDVPGSTAEARHWHIFSAALTPADAKKGRG